MAVPYETTGRKRQKQRTRDALLAAAHSLLGGGHTPTVEQTADTAGISRTTAYRYFPNQRALLLAAIPDIARPTLLPEDAPDDVRARLDHVVTQQTEILHMWEPQLRTALQLALEQGTTAPPQDRPVLRRGRAIEWIVEALEPLAATHPGVDRRRLAIAIRATCGIEAWVWLTDVAGVSRTDAAALMRDSAAALLDAALSGSRSSAAGSERHTASGSG